MTETESYLFDFAQRLVRRARLGRRWFFYGGRCVAFFKGES